MKNLSTLNVFFNEYTDTPSSKKLVGTLALYKGKFAAFEYETEWLVNGFSISPFSLPLEKQVFVPELDPFDGLYGVFNDSLPDGWGRLLVDRFLKRNNVNPDELSVLDRLSIIGPSGMGALSYEPSSFLEHDQKPFIDLDTLSRECTKILSSQFSENLDVLFNLAGSSGGARPKILTQIEGEEWIIKFPSSFDSSSSGIMEYEYSLCAKECGILMTETRLFPSNICSGYFGIKRFDRNPVRKHMVSVSGLLETSHRIPNLDYNTLMLLTIQLTKNAQEVEKLFRLMCFNVFAHNRDDHSKNFSFIFNRDKKCWELSPAYDLTYSTSIGGEHATTIDGEGRNPTLENILSAAQKAGIKVSRAKEIADFIQNKTEALKHLL